MLYRTGRRYEYCGYSCVYASTLSTHYVYIGTPHLTAAHQGGTPESNRTHRSRQGRPPPPRSVSTRHRNPPALAAQSSPPSPRILWQRPHMFSAWRPVLASYGERISTGPVARLPWHTLGCFLPRAPPQGHPESRPLPRAHRVKGGHPGKCDARCRGCWACCSSPRAEGCARTGFAASVQ